MNIKVCCGNMRGYLDNSYITHNGESVVIDTSVYEENEVEISYCPFCGKKIKLENFKEIK